MSLRLLNSRMNALKCGGRPWGLVVYRYFTGILIIAFYKGDLL
jgi:hypothetical protein